MLKLRKVAVTGGIATGKSTVCQIFQELGAYTVSADQITHQLLSSDRVLIQQIVSLLGDTVLSEGLIDRNKVAQVVFRSPVFLRELEKLIHPLVKAEIERQWHQAAQQKDCFLFVVEMPLLFEVGWEAWYDATVAVTASQEQSLRRFCAAAQRTEAEYFQRMSRLLPNDEKAKRATYVIENNEDLEELKKKVKFLYQLLTQDKE
jgi:dephospho-CoA kinase